MENINSQNYWNSRFTSLNWGKAGSIQTLEYAKANTQFMNIPVDFDGKILDYGCALGDAIPVYLSKYPKAKLSGYDISSVAIDICKEKMGGIADFFTGDLNDIPAQDIIIASHVMEHITGDKNLINGLLKKCNNMYVFVPYKESPLYFEHVNYYDEEYYENAKEYKIFEVSYPMRNSIRTLIKQSLKFKFSLYNQFKKKIIMFHFQGSSESA